MSSYTRKSLSLLSASALFIAACSVQNPEAVKSPVTAGKQSDSIYPSSPELVTKSKALLKADGLNFKDLNANGKLDPYEDWRLPTQQRIDDLISQMTLEEKVGMMMIDTLNADWEGTLPDNAATYINSAYMTRFIFRNGIELTPVKQQRAGFGGQPITVLQAANFTNQIQELAEATRLGIPVVFKSNARNHFEKNAKAGINAAAGVFSEWPKEAGLAATRDDKVLENFAAAMAAEWKAIGLRGMYGYMADISTEPRWFRNHETFTEDAQLANHIISSLVKNLQGGPVNPDSGVVLTVKHFPGGGPQLNGLDPHYTFGKYQVYPAGQFAQHLVPFIGAINEGVASIMPYYGIPVDLTYDGMTYEQKGMAFSKEIVTDLLRTKLGFKGYVNSDTGIITQRAWGLEDATVPERIAMAINAGIDVLSGFHDNQEFAALVKNGMVSESRVNDAVSRLLWEQFQLGLFENPYVNAAQAQEIVGKQQFRDWASDAQRKSLVLLKNQEKLLPLAQSTEEKPITLVTLGMDKQVVSSEKYGSYKVLDALETGTLQLPANADYAIIRVEVSNPRQATGNYKSNDTATGGKISPYTGKAWGIDDSKLLPSPFGPDAALDDRLIFGGPAPYEADFLSFSKLAEATTWQISPSLADIKATIQKVGANKTIISVYFRQPYVLDEESQLKTAGALLAEFGISDAAFMDVITGQTAPQGKLPFALPSTIEAVLEQDSDAPGFDEQGTLYPFEFGLSY
jgi:beta-glucosidase